MEILEQLRTRLHQQLLRKELSIHQVKRRSVFMDNASSVGILFDATLQKDRDRVTGFTQKLKSQGKEVELLGYFKGNLKTNDFPFAHFDKKQLDWALRPKIDEVMAFAGRPFDLLITLSNKPTLPLDYIAAHSKARFRVGPFTENTFSYDLMIEHDDKNGLEAFLKQVLYYLEKMQPGQKTAVV